MLHRCVSGVLGLLVVAAGTLAAIYEWAVFGDVARNDVPRSQTITAVALLGAIVLGAMYLGFRFATFALFGPERKS